MNRTEMTCEEKLKEAMALLVLAGGEFESAENAPTTDWWKRYFLLDGAHMILTDEGWESGCGKSQYEQDAKDLDVPLSDFIRDEVNAP